jgi:hypothetical protein
VGVLEDCGNLEQIGAHGGGAVVKQHVTSAPDWVGIDRVVGGATQPLREDAPVACAGETSLLALGAACPPLLENAEPAPRRVLGRLG